MVFSNFPHWGHIVSAVLNTIAFILVLFLVVRSFRSQQSSYCSWPPLKRYFVIAGVIGCFFLIVQSLLILGCQVDLDYRYAYCKATIMCRTSTLCLVVAIFMHSTIFSYERLLGLTPGFRLFSSNFVEKQEYKFWKAYRILVAIVAVAALAITGVVAFTETASSVIKISSPSPSKLVTTFRLYFFAISAIFVMLVMGSSTYCYYRMLRIILSTSLKLARLKRTTEKGKVRRLEFKLYSMIALAVFLAFLMSADMVFNGTYLSLTNRVFISWQYWRMLCSSFDALAGNNPASH